MQRLSKNIALISFFSFCGIVSAQIQLVQVTSCGPAPMPGQGCTIPATGQGNLIVIGWQIGGHANTSNTIARINDSAGNVYYQVPNALSIDSSAGAVADIWYAMNSVAGATTLTVTPSTPVPHGGVVIWEFSGADPVAPLDQPACLNNQT